MNKQKRHNNFSNISLKSKRTRHYKIIEIEDDKTTDYEEERDIDNEAENTNKAKNNEAEDNEETEDSGREIFTEEDDEISEGEDNILDKNKKIQIK